jgi:O-antigen/teichoic acid export membrane protein
MISLLESPQKPSAHAWAADMKRVLAQTLSIQSLGVLLMLATTLLVARMGGADAQGNFALVKSLNDFLVAIFSLGMPSAIVYLINQNGHGHFVILRHIWRYSFALLLLLPMITYMVLYWLYPEAPAVTRIIQAVLIGAGSALMTGYGLQRAILLVRDDGPVFSFLSIIPGAIVTVTIIILLNRNTFAAEFAYAFAGIFGIILMHLGLRKALSGLPPEDPQLPLDWRMLRAQSSHVFVQGILFGLQVFLTNAALEFADPTMVAVGLFNVASMVITLPNLLVSLVAPVLFNRWSKSLTWAGYAAIKRNSLLLGGAAQILAMVAIPLITPVLSFIFGAEFVAASGAVKIMLGSVLAVFAGRIITPALQGLGCNWIVTWSCAARLGVGGALAITLMSQSYPPMLCFACGWLAGEYAALLMLLIVPHFTLKTVTQVH